MNKFAIGTLVLFVPPEDVSDNGVPRGSIGEVMDASKFLNEITNGDICVNFTKTPSNTVTGWWKVPHTWLKPLGGDGLLSDEDLEDNPYKVKEPAEDLVLTTVLT